MEWEEVKSLRRIADALEQANRDNRNLAKALHNIDLQALEKAEREEREHQSKELNKPIAKEISSLPKEDKYGLLLTLLWPWYKPQR